MTHRLSAKTVDITTLVVDAIVNAANSDLVPGGGVCGAIHRAAGPELAAACASEAPCPTGQARITPGFRLPARFVIHAVGPVWRGGGAGEADLLASAYRSSIALAREHGLSIVAFPAISTGIYGYPLAAATKVAVAAVRDAVGAGGPLDVVFACFSEEALRACEAEGVAVTPSAGAAPGARAPDDGTPRSGRGHGGGLERLRSPERAAMMEPARVVGFSTEGVSARTVLDVGAGAGLFAEAFLAAGFAVTGVDVNGEALALARRSVPGATFVEGAAEALPFEARSFDIVFMAHVLHEVDDPEQALREAARVARGRIVVVEWPYRREESGPPLEHRISPDEIGRISSRLGLGLLSRRSLARVDLYSFAPDSARRDPACSR